MGYLVINRLSRWGEFHPLSLQYSLIVSLAEYLQPREKGKWVWVRKAARTIHMQKTTKEEVGVKKTWVKWLKQDKKEYIIIHLLLCAPCSLIASIMMITGVYIVETVSLHIKKTLSTIGSDTWESHLANSLRREKELPLKSSPKWLLLLFCLSLPKLLMGSDGFLTLMLAPTFKVHSGRNSAQLLFGQGCCVLVTPYSSQSRL